MTGERSIFPLMLNSGATFDLARPRQSGFVIEDIAHGLSHTCRFAGQCRAFYSVAEHSVLVSEVSVGFEMHGLLHDAAEAFVGDVPSPIKNLVPSYRAIEAEIQSAVFDRFNLALELPSAVKDADRAVLRAELEQVMSSEAKRQLDLSGLPADIVVMFLDPQRAKRKFLDRFHQLQRRVSAA